MGWKKLGDHQFTFNEGSLNFTLTGGAFHDDDGDGVPDGVSFENGRPVFMNIKNLRDFHFDVPRGYIIVNGDEYKLVDLDNNAENGEELQLFRANAGFPTGEDRTIPSAYQRTAEDQFTYNTGSLHYTLTGSAFHDDDGDGVPDGVRIIGPKPSFGSQGEIFDTSVNAFHFKVPSGMLMVNGEQYKLAELDQNPDNGYELVIPEKAAAIGWTKLDQPMPGWAYKRPSDNNPINSGSFKLFGDGLVDKNGDGEPDGLTVPIVRIGDEVDGVRITQIGFEGLSGDVKLNHPQFSLGVFNDDNYDYRITKHGGDLYETLIQKISDGATVCVSSGTEAIETEGDGKINILASKSFKLDGKQINVDGSKYFTVKLKNGAIASMKEEVLGFKKSGEKFTFTGRPINAPWEKVKCSISGADLNEKDLKVAVLRNVRGLGVRLGFEGLSGDVKLNGKSLGILNDDKYTVHFTPLVDPNIAPENLAQVKSYELLGISPGARINSPGNWIILESDGVYHFADGNYLVATKPAHSVDELQKIVVDNGGRGVDVSIEKGSIVPTNGLSLVAGAVAFNGEDIVEKPEKKIDDSAQIEEKMFGKPLRAGGGGEGEGGEAVEAVDAVEAVETSAEVEVDLTSNDQDKGESIDLLEGDPNEDEEVAVDLTSVEQKDRSVELAVENETIEEVQPQDESIELVRFALFDDLNQSEFKLIENAARRSSETAAPVEKESELDALMKFSLEEILPVESGGSIEIERPTFETMTYVTAGSKADEQKDNGVGASTAAAVAFKENF